MKTSCPACGSTDVKVSQVEQSLPVPYGPTAKFIVKEYTCATCGEAGDFAGENDTIIKKELEKSINASINHMIDELAKHSISAAYFERAFRLPTRTIARWKKGAQTASAVALLRTVNTYPWLLEVADANFEDKVADYKVVEAAGKIICGPFRDRVKGACLGFVATSAQIGLYANFVLQGQDEVQVTTDAKATVKIQQPNTALLECVTNE